MTVAVKDGEIKCPYPDLCHIAFKTFMSQKPQDIDVICVEAK